MQNKMKLPTKAVMFCIGSTMDCLKNNYNT